MEEKKHNPKRTALRVVSLLIGIFAFLGSFFVIKPGNSGLVIRLGTIAREVQPGLHFKLPFFERVERFNVRQVKDEIDSGAASKDLQAIHTILAVTYSIKNSSVRSIFTEFGSRESLQEKTIEPSVQECMKSITAEFTAEELITKRHVVSDKIKSVIVQKLSPYGVLVHEIAIVNFSFSKEFSDSVEDKNVAVQKTLKAERDLERIKVEAQQKIETAKAEAESLKIQKQQITKEMLQLRFIQKWNGEMPKVVGAKDMMMNIGDVK